MKRTGLIALITLLNMTAPFSTDVYLPSLPTLSEHFGTTAGMVNLTLAGFFFFFAAGMLLFGPLSDKYGRKPVLLAGLLVYLACSAFCAMSATIWQLIAFRILQALGAGCMVSVSMALVKDCFQGRTRGTILAIIQTMSVLAPMLAPVIGAWILQFTSWRGTFWALCVISSICLIVALFLQETLKPESRYRGNVFGSLGRLIVVAKNRAFTAFLFITALVSVMFMAHLAMSSYIYIEHFGLTETGFSLFFAFQSFLLMFGPIVYIRLNGRVPVRSVVTVSFVICVASGCAVVFIGHISPYVFLLSFFPIAFISSMFRPLAANTLLSQQDNDTGSASSLINFGKTGMGSVGMLLGGLPWVNFVTGLGIIAVSVSSLALCLWLLFVKSGLKLREE